MVDYNLAHNNNTFMDTLAINKAKKLDKDLNINTLEKNPEETDINLNRNRQGKQRYRSIIEIESGSPSDTITIDTISESSDNIEDFYGVVLDSTPEDVNLQVAIEASLKDQNDHVSYSRCSNMQSFIPCTNFFDKKSIHEATETIENNDILGGAVENISFSVEPAAVQHSNRILKRKIVDSNSNEFENTEIGKKVKIVESDNDEDILKDKQDSLEAPSEHGIETSDSDDDFIEVKVDLKNVGEDSLFPASLFDMANTIGDDTVSAKDGLKVGIQNPIKSNAPVSIYRKTKSKNGQDNVDFIEIIDDDASTSGSSSDILEITDGMATTKGGASLKIAEEMETRMGGASLEIDIAKSDNILDIDVSSSDISESTEKQIKSYEGEEQTDVCTLGYKVSQITDAYPSIGNHKLIAGVFMQNLKKQTYANSLLEIVGDTTSLQPDKDVSRGMDIMVSEPDDRCMEGADEISILTHSDSLAHAVAEYKHLEHTVTDGQNLETSPRGVADLVRQFKSLNENSIRALRDNLNYETKQLRQEQGRQERLAIGITDQMYTDAQELLRLFGIPYVVSPTEAEAQCAYLEIMKLTQGTITDDSDIWLFGGKCVFKNFFNQAKHVECFKDVNITSQLGLVRESLINIALLCGSDYTEGIRGVGPVIAMEILAEFPGEGIEGLNRFRSWWDDAQKQIKIPVNESKLLAKLRTLDVRSDFPNPQVVDAYLSPAVDDSTEKFSWSLPDLDELRHFAVSRLGWNAAKTDKLLLPVLKRLNEKKAQRPITAFFQPEVYMQPAKMKSKRLQNVVNKFRNPSKSVENSVAGTTVKSQSEAKPNRKHLKRALKVASDIGVTKNDESMINDSLCVTTCSEQLGLGQGSGFERKEISQMYNVKNLEPSEASLFRKELLGDDDSLMLNVNEMHVSESSSSDSESESDGEAIVKAELNVQEILNLKMGFSITDFAQHSQTGEMGLKVGETDDEGTNTKKNESSSFENVCLGNADAQQAENDVVNKKVVDESLCDTLEGGFIKEDDSDAWQFEVYSNTAECIYDGKLELFEKKSHIGLSEENDISNKVGIFEDKLAKMIQNSAKPTKMTQNASKQENITQNASKRENLTQDTSKNNSQKRLEKGLDLPLSRSKRASCTRNLDGSETAKKCLKHEKVLAASAGGVQSQIEDKTIETADTLSHDQKSCAKAICEASDDVKEELFCDLQPSDSVKKLAQSISATNILNPIVTGVPWAKRGKGKCTTGKSQKKGKHQKIVPLETIVKRPLRKTDLGPRVTIDLSESDSDS